MAGGVKLTEQVEAEAGIIQVIESKIPPLGELKVTFSPPLTVSKFALIVAVLPVVIFGVLVLIERGESGVSVDLLL